MSACHATACTSRAWTKQRSSRGLRTSRPPARSSSDSGCVFQSAPLRRNTAQPTCSRLPLGLDRRHADLGIPMAEQPLVDGAAQGEVGSADGRSREAPGRPQTTALAIALTTGSISRGEQPPRCRPRAKLEKLVRDRRGGSSAAVPDQHSPSSMIRRRRLSQVALCSALGARRFDAR